MKIYLYSFAKKRNSTAQPSGGYEVEVKLKENCSIYHPSFILNHNAPDFNYIKAIFPDLRPTHEGENFTYFYFVDDIIWNTDRIITANCTCDVLATYKNTIVGTRANIMYCADSIYNNIVDNRLPVYSTAFYEETNINLGSTDIPTPYEGSALHIVDSVSSNEQLSIILSVTGKGSFGAYLMQYEDDLKEILDGVDDYTNGFIDILTGLKQLFYGGTAAECLKAAIALPITLDNIDVGASNTEPLYLGNYPCKKTVGQALTPIYVYPVNKKILSGKYRLSIPWTTPEGWQRCSPYRQLYLYFPFVGLMQLNTSEMANDIFVDVSYSVNITSGDISVIVEGVREETLETRIVATASGNLAMNTPFGSTGIDTTRLTQSIGAGVAAAGASAAMFATGNVIGGALTLAGGIAGAAGGTISAMGGTGNGEGGLGGGASSGLDKHIRLFVVGHTLTATPDTWAATYGKPYMRPDTIRNHTGLVITEGFSLSVEAPKDMIEEVNRLMDGGVYIE